jgi:hypothetical protein
MSLDTDQIYKRIGQRNNNNFMCKTRLEHRPFECCLSDKDPAPQIRDHKQSHSSLFIHHSPHSTQTCFKRTTFSIATTVDSESRFHKHGEEDMENAR